MDAVMMAHQIIGMHEDLNSYRDAYNAKHKEYEALRERYDKLLDESLKHAQIMQANVLKLALSNVSISEVFVIYKDDQMMEYSAPEVLFIYEDQEEAARVVARLQYNERDHVEYYALGWELRRKKQEIGAEDGVVL